VSADIRIYRAERGLWVAELVGVTVYGKTWAQVCRRVKHVMARRGRAL
jgi:hypothetical protein